MEEKLQIILQDIEEHGPYGTEWTHGSEDIKSNSALGKIILSHMEKVPESLVSEIQKFLGPDLAQKNIYRRPNFTKYYSWAVPCREALIEIKKFVENDKCLEVGSGLWAHLLQLSGIDIVATDNKLEKYPKFWIEELNANDAMVKYNDRNVLFLSWSRINPTENFNGSKIIFIGENKGGCTKGHPNKEEWNLVSECEINDKIKFYTKKDNKN